MVDVADRGGGAEEGRVVGNDYGPNLSQFLACDDFPGKVLGLATEELSEMPDGLKVFGICVSVTA